MPEWRNPTREQRQGGHALKSQTFVALQHLSELKQRCAVPQRHSTSHGRASHMYVQVDGF